MAESILRALGLALLLPALHGPLIGQTTGDQLREQIQEDWERHRDVVLSYVEAMPEEHFGFRPTPDVRTFAEQIEHIVTDHVAIVASAFQRDDRPGLGSPEEYLGVKAALLAHVRAGYGYVLGVVGEASDADLLDMGEVFGRYRVSRRRALEGALEHGTWTLGQVVPYLRLNGVTPPPYIVFPLSTQKEGWEPPPP
jgi:hypothetical protein